MGIVVVLTLLLAVFSMRTDFKNNSIHEDYMSLENTNAVKGIFVILIVLTHFQQYVPVTWSKLDYPFVFVREYIGQLVVAPFLFVSGFGVFKSYQKKGIRYIKSFPKHRLLKTLLHFDIGVLVFIIIDILFREQYSIIEYITAFSGWNSIGNSNWYIFAILWLYGITWIAGGLTRIKDKEGAALSFVIALTIGVLLYIAFISQFKGPVFYNTVICYPIGMWFAMCESRIKDASRHLLIWFAEICLLGVCFLAAYLKSPVYSVKSGLFPIMIFLFTMRFCFNSRILIWFGQHIFSVYMLQRLPMIIFEKLGLADWNVNIYLLAVLTFTILLACVYDIAMKKIDNRLGL